MHRRMRLRRARAWPALVGWAAMAAGTVLRTAPGLLAAPVIVWGVWEIYRPAGIIAAGLALLAVDRQTPNAGASGDMP